MQVAVGDGLYASYIFNIHDFCRREHIHISRVRAALKLLQQNNYLTLTEEVDNPARIIFTTGRDDLYKIRVCQDELDNIIRVILRLYDGVFTEFRSIDEKQIAAISGYTIDKVRELLKRMWQMRIIRYIPANTTPILFFNEERLPTNDLYISPESYTHRLRLTQERFENVLRYIGNEQSCRSVMMQNYFGDTDTTVCGVCDICINKKKEINNKSNSLEDKVLTLIREQNLTSRELCRFIKHDPQEIASAVEKLKAEDKIYADRGGKLIIIE